MENYEPVYINADDVTYQSMTDNTYDDTVMNSPNAAAAADCRPKLPPRTNPSRKHGVVKPKSHHGQMTKKQKDTLIKNWTLIVENVMVGDIIDKLIEKGIVDISMRQEIMSPVVEKDKTVRFMEYLLRRGSEAYHHFLEVLKINYDFVYKEIMSSKTEVNMYPFAYHEPPMDGQALRDKISGFIRVVPQDQRKEKKLEIERMESDYEVLDQSIGVKMGSMTKQWKDEQKGIKLDKGDEVFIISEDDMVDEITIQTRFGPMKVGRNLVKIKGDPTLERYYFNHGEISASQAKIFVDQTVRKSERNGVYLLYKSSQCKSCQYHLCVGFFRERTSDYHIKSDTGYYLVKEGRATSPNDSIKEKKKRFASITDMINFYTHTSDKVLDGVLQWPMCDAESDLNPEDDFAEPHKVLKKSDYIPTSSLLGRGYYGIITKGTIRSSNMTIAIKSPNRLHQAKAHRDDLYREALLLSSLNHENILKLIGVYFQDTAHVATEYAIKGDLLTLLRSKKRKRDSEIEMKEFSSYAQQIACGMKYLEEQCIVHRDLALRNIFVFENKLVKIGDYGQARRLYGPESTYFVTKKDVLSTRWSAPETLATLRHSTKSDVWSYGVVLFELYSYGETPYKNMKTDQVWGFVVVEGGRLQKPERCPTDMYNVMLSCWHKEAPKRPSFAHIYESLWLSNYSMLYPGVLPTARSEDEYIQALRRAEAIDDYGEVDSDDGRERIQSYCSLYNA